MLIGGGLVTKLCPALATPQTVTSRLLCPWDSPHKNTGVGGHALLQGTFPTQGLNRVSCTAGRFFTVWAWKGQRETSGFTLVVCFASAVSGTTEGPGLRKGTDRPGRGSCSLSPADASRGDLNPSLHSAPAIRPTAPEPHQGSPRLPDSQPAQCWLSFWFFQEAFC